MTSLFVTLILGIISSALVTYVAFLLKKLQGYPRNFLKRINAEESMKKEIIKSSIVKFFGISQTNLDKYLSEIVDWAKQYNKTIPLEEIYVFFAKNEVGNIWDKLNFGKKIVKVIEKVSKLLTNSHFKSIAPKFSKVVFFQMGQISFFGGSVIKYPNDLKTIYVVNYTPGPQKDSDTKLSYTYKLISKKKKSNNLFTRYSTAFEYLEHSSKELFGFKIDDVCAWNSSTKLWDDFETKHGVYEATMRDLITFSQIPPNSEVLDIGAGTGRMSKIIVDLTNIKKLLLLDNSPQMLGYIGKNYSNPKIDYILSDARLKNPLYGCYEKYQFDLILCHFSIHLILSDDFNEETFSYIWKNHLKTKGKFIFSLHNTIFSGYIPKGYEEWNDPLREKIEEFTKEHGFKKKNSIIFDIDKLISNFKIAGLKFLDKKIVNYTRTMADRLDMWKVPGIFTNSFDIPEEHWKSFIDYITLLERDLINLDTKPMTVIYLAFEK